MEDAIVNFEADRFTFVYENLSFLTNSLKETGIREIQSREGGDVVSVSSYLIAPERSISILFHSQMLEEDLLSCQIYIWDEVTAELGYRHCPPFRTIALLATRLVQIANRLRMDYDQVCGHNDMTGGYYFFVDMEIITHHEIHIVDVTNIEDDEEEEDGLLDEQITSQRTALSKTTIEKLEAGCGRFINGDDETKELGRCCICLEEMCGGKRLQLVGLPCKHVFHESCLLPWLDNTDSCPLCRRNTLEDY